MQGLKGETGDVGPTGPQGPAGARGPAGEDGLDCTCPYCTGDVEIFDAAVARGDTGVVQLFHTAQQEIKPESKILFSDATFAFTTVPYGESEFRAQLMGMYEVNCMIASVDQDAVFALFENDVELAGTRFFVRANDTFSGTFLINTTANDVALSLRNVDKEKTVIIGAGVPEGCLAASMSIELISSMVPVEEE